MALNNYFQHRNHVNEQNLHEDLIVESIQVFGHEVSYLPRKLKSEIDYELNDNLKIN